MKFVFTKEEVANALSMPLAEFEENLSSLEVLDFPKPIPGLRERWSIIDVINWVNCKSSRTTTGPSFGNVEHFNRLN